MQLTNCFLYPLLILGPLASTALAQQPAGGPPPPGSIFGPPQPVEMEITAGGFEGWEGERPDRGTAGTVKLTNQAGTLGILHVFGEERDGVATRNLAAGVRFLPAASIPFLKKYPDLFDIKAGGSWRQDAPDQTLGFYGTTRLDPMGRNYTKVRVGLEGARDSEGLRKGARFADLQYKLLTRESWVVRELRLGRILEQVDLLGLVSRIREEELVTQRGRPTGETRWTEHTIRGAGLNFYLSPNQHLMFGLTGLDEDDSGFSKMVSYGRYRPVRGAQPKLPVFYFGSYKWDDISDFFIGGVSVGGAEKGGRNQLVRPAVTGMMQGLFTNSGGLLELRDIRRLEELTSRYGTRTQELGRVSVLFAYQDIRASDRTNPQWGTGHQGFGDVELYVIPAYYFRGLRTPFLSVAYEWENNIDFNPRNGFSTKHTDSWSVGGGAQLPGDLYFTILAIPKVERGRLKTTEVQAELYVRFHPKDVIHFGR